MAKFRTIKVYIARNYRLSLGLFASFFVFVMFAMILFLTSIHSAYIAKQYYNLLEYDIAGYTLNVQSDENVFIQNSSLRLSKNTEEMDNLNYIDTFLVMENENTTYNATPNLINDTSLLMEYTKLLSNEISFSKQVSDLYNIKVGDVVIIKYQNLFHEFTVRNIFDYTFGFLTYDSESSGMAVIGYNAQLESTSNQVYVNYVVEDGIIFTEATLKNSLIDQANFDLLKYIIIFTVFLLGSILLIEFVSQSINLEKGIVQFGALKDYKYLSNNNLSAKTTFLTIFIEKSIKYVFPIILALLMYLCFYLQYSQMTFILSLIPMLILVIGIVILSAIYAIKI